MGLLKPCPCFFCVVGRCFLFHQNAFIRPLTIHLCARHGAGCWDSAVSRKRQSSNSGINCWKARKDLGWPNKATNEQELHSRALNERTWCSENVSKASGLGEKVREDFPEEVTIVVRDAWWVRTRVAFQALWNQSAWHLQGGGSRPVWLAESAGDRQGWNRRRGQTMKVLDPSRDRTFISYIAWETCQRFISQRQEQLYVLKGSLELKSRRHIAGGEGVRGDQAVFQASDGGFCNQGGDRKQAGDGK